MNTTVFYRLVPPSGHFSTINKDTLEEIQAEYIKAGQCNEDASEKHKIYWKTHQAGCKIVKVIEITEDI